jgi:hypothetical protein
MNKVSHNTAPHASARDKRLIPRRFVSVCPGHQVR